MPEVNKLVGILSLVALLLIVSLTLEYVTLHTVSSKCQVQYVAVKEQVVVTPTPTPAPTATPSASVKRLIK